MPELSPRLREVLQDGWNRLSVAEQQELGVSALIYSLATPASLHPADLEHGAVEAALLLNELACDDEGRLRSSPPARRRRFSSARRAIANA